MSKTIDEHVVEMRFDNKEFERNARTTMNTLTRLKDALSFTKSTEALENLGKATKDIKLDGIAAGIEVLEKRFSTMGIAGMRVIENVTDALMNKLGKAVNFVSDSIVSGGIKRAMNIENAHFQLQALLKDETKVQAVMADAMESVDGTAYAYDEAAKAAAQFSASGIQAGEDMLNALKGITGVAAMTNSDFESISNIFTTVAGNGRLMGDQLLQLSSRGLNAASTLADYFKEVRGQANMTEATVREMVSKGKISFKDFSDAMTWAFGDSAKRANETFTGAFSNMKSALARIGAGFISPLVEQNGEVVKLFNALRIQINNVKSALVFDEQTSAIAGLAKVTGLEKDELKEMFKTIKSNGSVSVSDLNKLGKAGANAAGSLTKYVNGVVDGSIRASYATTSTLKELTKGMKVSEAQIVEYVREGKISVDIFQSALETSFGYQKALSKQFTDFFLDSVQKLVQAIEATDLTKPMEAFYHGVEAVKNVFKGLGSVAKPILSAFRDVFLTFSGDDMISFASAVEKVTAKLRLSEKGSKNLHDAFAGVLSIVKLLVDGFGKLFGISTEAIGPIGSLIDLFLSLAGGTGRALSTFSEWIRRSPIISKAFDNIAFGFKTAANWLTYLISHFDDFGKAIYNLPATQKLIKLIVDAFSQLGTVAAPYIDILIKKIKEFSEWVIKMVPKKAEQALDGFVRMISGVVDALNDINLSKPSEWFGIFADKIQKLLNVINGNEGLNTFITNANRFSKDLNKGFTFDQLFDNIDTFKDKIKKLITWIQDTVVPSLSGFSLGGAAATAGGFGLIYTLSNISKALNNLTKSIKSWTKIPDMFKNLFGSVKDTLRAYQSELKASALIKIAGAIAILAGAITVLSFADMKRAWQATAMLSLIGIGLTVAVGYLLNAVNKEKKVEDALTTFTKGLAKAMSDLGKAAKWKAIGGAFKDFGASILMISGSIIALGLMYRKDPEAFKLATLLVGTIASVLTLIMFVMTELGNKMSKGMTGFSKAAFGVLSLSLSLTMIISALNKLFKMEFPSDWETKLGVLSLLLVEMAIIALTLGASSKMAGDSKISSAPFIALAALLVVTVSSLNKLFKMDIPDDFKIKLGILGGIFAGLAALMLIVGATSRIAGGQMKATGSILAMTVFLATTVGALMILTIIPGDKLLKGATALGVVLLGLGVALAGAGKIVSKEASKAILNMAIMTGAIVAALGFLSLISFDKLAKATVSLGSILLALGHNFNQLSKITNKSTLSTILGMMMIIAEIGGVLYILSTRPWQGMLASAAAMSAVLLEFSQMLKQISSLSGLKMDKMKAVLAASTAMLPIAASLLILSNQPWKGMLASGVAMSAVLLAFSEAMKRISALKGIKEEKIKEFLKASLIFAPIGIALYALSNQPWSGMLASGVALSSTLIAFAYAFKIVESTKPDISALNLFLSAVAMIAPIGVALFVLADKDWAGMLSAAGSLSLVLLAMTASLAILSKVKVDPATAATTALALGAFVAIVSGLMTVLILAFENLSGYEAYFDSGIAVMTKIAEGLGRFFGAIVGGALSEVSNAFPKIGENLSWFWEKASSFLYGMAGIPATTFTNMILLSASLIAFTVAELIAGLTSLVGTGLLIGIGTELSAFMVAALPFFDALTLIKPEIVDSAKSVVDMILAFTAAEIIQGIGDFLGFSGSLADFGKELLAFGPSLAEFALVVKDVKPEAVQGAANAASILMELASKLPGTDGLAQKIFGEQKSLSDFGAELLLFGPSLVAFSAIVKDVKPEAVQGAANAAGIMAELANTLPEKDSLASTIFGGKSTDIDDFGGQLQTFAGYFKSFNESLGLIDLTQLDASIDAITRIMQMAIDMSLIDTSGMIGFVEALNKISYTGINEFINAFSDIEQKMYEIGQFAVAGIIRGLEDTSSLTVAATRMASVVIDAARSRLKINSPSKEMEEIGHFVDEGIAVGIEKNATRPEKASAKMANLVNEAARDVLGVHSDSTEGIDIGENFDNGIATGLKNNVGKIKDAATKAGSTLVDTVTKYTSEAGVNLDSVYSLYEGNLSDIDSTLKDGIKIYDEYTTDSKELDEKNIQNKKTNSTKTKKLNKDSVDEEKNYWAKLLKIKKAGVDGAKYQDMSLAEFEEDVFKQTVDIWKNYTDQLTSTAESVFDQTDPFEELSKKEAKSKDEIKQNLENQIKDYKEFAETLAVVSNRLGDSDFGDYVRNMSVDSLEQLKVLNSMTDDELTEYSNLYDTKMAYATNIASTKLYDLKQETEAQLEDLFGVMEGSVILDEFAQNFNGTMESITSYLTKIVEPVSDELKTQIGVMDNKIQKEVKEDFYETGEQGGQGFANGLLSKIAECGKAGAKIAAAAYNAAKKELDEHSPSKKMGEVGNFAGLGFINKLSQYISKSEIVGRDIGQSSIKGISRAVQEMSSILDDENFDLNPTITPVLDLSEVRSSASDINRLFNESIKITSMDVGSVSKLVNESKQVTKERKDEDAGKTENNYTFNQYNTSPKSLSEIDIYRQTKNQFSMLKEVKQ